MSDYVYQEYPKCLYHETNELTVTVSSIDQELDMAALGWQTAEQHYGYQTIVPPDAADLRKVEIEQDHEVDVSQEQEQDHA